MRDRYRKHSYPLFGQHLDSDHASSLAQSFAVLNRSRLPVHIPYSTISDQNMQPCSLQLLMVPNQLHLGWFFFFFILIP